MGGSRSVINDSGIRKLILIIEDEQVNRAILGNVLDKGYDVIFAETGAEAMASIRERSDELSLILLDLNLPDMNGMSILSWLKEDEDLRHIPVVVLTSDIEAEVESLNLGASDFIPKPYPNSEVIIARVNRSIELSESRLTIGETERDNLTGLYNREYFYRYSEQFDSRNKGLDMDAIVININHFHLINERYGRAYADGVLKRIADKIKEVVSESGGFACRREADSFLIYRPHFSDYTEMLDIISEGASGEGKTDNVVRLRMGVYPNADKSIEIERRFDRARLAADTVRSTFTKAVAVYDNALHQSALFSEQLLIDFPRAIEEKQFQVYYQPKFDIRGEDHKLSSAEALVRWMHPEFGMVSPGLFIGILEKNGLIQQLDRYVWREAARQVREWKDELDISLPVSVNVSRVDMFDPDIVEFLDGVVEESGITHKELILEVTESAYTEDSEHIIRTVEAFRRSGFFIEMDDFGSGYSSLNMLSNLPIDALKLDMQFIRSAFKNGKNTRMLEIVIEIADSLAVPVIAEGVETAEQLFTLKSMGCDIVQGYFFSPPVPAEDFEDIIINSASKGRAELQEKKRKYRKLAHDRFTYEAMHDSLTGLYNHSAFDILLFDADRKHSTLLLVDIDDYYHIVRREGQEAADKVVNRVAQELRDHFRASDFICRLSDKEFAVILTRVNSSEKEIIGSKIAVIEEKLREKEEGIPDAKISFGIAFGDKNHPHRDIFQEADADLKGDG